MSITAVGNATTVYQQPDSPSYSYSLDGDQVIRKYECADYSTLNTNRPGIGTVVSGDSADMRVIEVTITPDASGGKWVMQVTSTNKTVDPAVAAVEMVDQKEYSIEWSKVDKDIRYHPLFTADGIYELTLRDRIDVERWEQESDAVVKAEYAYNNDGTGGPEDWSSQSSDSITYLSANAQALASRLIRGQDSYSIWIPIVRRTRRYKGGKPTTGGCGRIDTPPSQANPPDETNGTDPNPYVYVKTNDSATLSNRIWTRTEEWTGFIEIDTEIYNNV